MATTPSTPLVDPSARPKRPRAETQSAGAGDSTTAANTTGDPTTTSTAAQSSRVSKRRKELQGDVSDIPTEDGGAGDTTEPNADPDGEADATDGGVPALDARVRRSKKTRLLSGEEKRKKFLEKYSGMTPEQVLDTLSKGWRSRVYEHYRKPLIIRGRTAAIIHRFVCKKYPSKHVDRSDYEDSTGNLKRHADNCDPEDTPEAEAITAFASGATYSPARLRFLLAMWCSARHRPFAIVDDPEFREVLRMLYNKVEVPSRFTVSRDIQTILDETTVKLLQRFEEYKGKIHLCVDGWTSPNVMSFLGVTAHWHEAGEIRHIILDFIRLTKAHTGEYLAEKLLECMRKFGIEDKVLAVVCDNASNNDKMLDEMKKHLPQFRGREVRVRCFGHVLNLVVKAILSQFARKRKARGETSDDLPEAEKDLDELSDDEVDEDDIEAAEEADEDREAADDEILTTIDEEHPEVVLTRTEIKEGQLALEKILKLSVKVWHSPTIREELGKLADGAALNSSVLVRSVKTRWNTVTHVLERAIEMQDVLDTLCNMSQFNKRTGARLRRFILSEDDWKLIDQLYRLLDPFSFATNQISTSSRALVHEVIPYMDLLTEHVDRFAADATLAPSVRAAAKRGRLILDKYYQLTDETFIYRAAMILHPKYKTAYFRSKDWPEDWIEEAVSLLRSEWLSRYKKRTSASQSEGAAASTASTSSRERVGTGRKSANASTAEGTRALFAQLSASNVASTKDPLEVYLEAPPLPTIADPLAYWRVLLETDDDPSLAQMALDFLSVPATSTDVERAFSRGRLTVSRLRYSLNDASVRASTLLGSWARIPELIAEREVIAHLRGRPLAAQSTATPHVGEGDSDVEIVPGPSTAGRKSREVPS